MITQKSKFCIIFYKTLEMSFCFMLFQTSKTVPIFFLPLCAARVFVVIRFFIHRETIDTNFPATPLHERRQPKRLTAQRMAVGHQEKYAQKTHTHRYLEKARHWIDRTKAPAFSIPAKKYCVHPARRLSSDADTLVLDSCRHHSESSTPPREVQHELHCTAPCFPA